MSLTATGSPYPSVHVIEGIYQYRTKLGHASFPDYLDEDVEITILGQDHKLGGTYKGKKAYQDIAYEFANTLDLSKFHKLDIVKVIGGGEQAWACVELKATGTTTAGDPFHHEYVYILKFNLDGKIVQIRGFFDTKQIDGHLDKNKKPN